MNIEKIGEIDQYTLLYINDNDDEELIYMLNKVSNENIEIRYLDYMDECDYETIDIDMENIIYALKGISIYLKINKIYIGDYSEFCGFIIIYKDKCYGISVEEFKILENKLILKEKLETELKSTDVKTKRSKI